MHFYAWKKGLKTGMYYLRTKAATDIIKFTVEKHSTQQPQQQTVQQTGDENPASIACSLDDQES